VTLVPKGVFAPVVSTFHPKTEALDAGAFSANIVSHLANGLDGVVICGSTGEAALLTEAERLELLEAARRVTPVGKLVIMGCGAESTRLTEHRCREAQTVGADAVLVVAPHYYSNAMTERALRTHYLRVADASPLPVLLYNIPKYMHFKLSPELVAGLATHQNIIGIKDSSGDLELLGGYLKAQSDTFTVITGNGGQLHEAMLAGARAGILAVSLFGAAHSAAIYAAHVSGDHAAAAALQARMKPLAATIVGELGVPGVKAALDAVGLHGGVTRGPLLNLDTIGVARVRELIASL
jgi:4-hydroxy-2-oxoglutarate aldolase